MANNRIYLVHQPSGLALGLGKRMAYGWYAHGPIEEERLNRFYDLALDECEKARDQDDFIVVLESDDSWRFKESAGDKVYRFERFDPLDMAKT